ncbi:MAG: transporter substrate-binding domain-containing protein [Desulfobacterales bacterium]|nr:transporter substrate-binding domain-containing protein [Desulfobacterales bacterium]
MADVNLNGPDHELLKTVAMQLDKELVMVPAPFRRRLALMKSGDIDIMVGLLKRPDREAYIHYIDPPYKKRSDTVFILRRESQLTLNTYEDLRKIKIGVIIGAKYFPRFDGDTRLLKEAVPKDNMNMEKLLRGRIDAMIHPEFAGIDLINRMGASQRVRIAPFRFSRRKLVYIGISKRSALMDHLPRIESEITRMVEDGTILALISEYYETRGLPVPAF